jgi:peroxiredoxin
MKLHILILAFLTPFMALAQSPNFTLSAKIGNLNKPAKAYIDYMDSGVSHEDSTELVNGAFRFSGHISGNSYARMALAPKGEGKMKAIYTGDVIYFYFGKEQVQITSKDSLSNAVFTGSKTYDAHRAYNKAIGGSIMELTKAVNADFNSGTPEDQKDTAFTKAVDARYRQNLNNRTEKQLQFAAAHPNSFFGLVALSEVMGNKQNEARMEAIYKTLSPELKATDMGKELDQRISAKRIAMGTKAPGFTQNDVNGNPVTLSKIKGKLILVEFWASWCAPCRAENPNLVKQYNLYKDKGFQIISVSLDDKKPNWLAAIAKDGLPWTHVSDLKGWNNEVGRMYGIRSVPASFLLDGDGMIVGKDLRGESLNKKLEEVFNTK